MLSISKLPACCPYIIMRKIGEGGGGQVYQAMHKETKDCVAIKVINKEDITHYLLFDGNQVPAEIVLLAKLSHPNIVKYIDYFKYLEHWCLVMEYLSEYRALFEYSCDLGMISERVTQCITQQLFKTIRYCYKKNVDHCDIKDTNVMVNPKNSHIKIVDFGWGRLIKNEPYTAMQGTPLFLPPELYISNSYMPIPGSIWAIGCFVFTCLTGKIPFNSTNKIKSHAVPWEFLPKNLSTECHDFLRACFSEAVCDRDDFKIMAEYAWIRNNGKRSISIYSKSQLHA